MLRLEYLRVVCARRIFIFTQFDRTHFASGFIQSLGNTRVQTIQKRLIPAFVNDGMRKVQIMSQPLQTWPPRVDCEARSDAIHKPLGGAD